MTALIHGVIKRCPVTGKVALDVQSPMLQEVRFRETQGSINQFHEGIITPSLIGLHTNNM